MSSSVFKVYMYALIGTVKYPIAKDESILFLDASNLIAGTISGLTISPTTSSVV